MRVIVGADVGGTFTDVVAIEDGVLTTHKTSTTRDQSDGVAEAMDALRGDSKAAGLVHGTTVATNALLERSGATTALVTDEGFEDVIEIARQDRPSLYDSFADRSNPLVERTARFGVADEGFEIDLSGYGAVAVSYIDGHTTPEREMRAAAIIEQSHPSMPVSLSSVVAPEFREFERTSTTVLNAYLSPATSRYLRSLDETVIGGDRAQTVSVMRSSGGLMSIAQASELPAAVLLSGPAGGVVAATEIAASLDLDEVISFDMGGTSTDVCRIGPKGADVAFERSIDGYACRLPSVAIHTVGAGGGSIAWIDPGGALRVGPRSAGALPGPVAYGRGGAEPTVTDANIVLGRIDPNLRLGGSVSLDLDAARDAVASLGQEVGLDPTETALGILRIAEDVMARAVRTVTVEQGFDPSEAHLVAFGGAGGLHAVAVAKSLRMRGVIVPRHAGVLSAVGLLLAPPRSDGVAAVHISGEDLADAVSAAGALSTQTSGSLREAGSEPLEIRLSVDVRYIGQSHEISVPWRTDEPLRVIEQRFEDAHLERMGFARHGDPVELVAVRCTALGEPPATLASVASTETQSGVAGVRDIVDSSGRTTPAGLLRRESLAAGSRHSGPAIVEESDSTTFVGEGDVLLVHDDGSLEITW